MPIVTGKKRQIGRRSSAFGSRPVMPTSRRASTMIIGAIARIGMVCEAMIHGIRLRRASARGRYHRQHDAEQRAEDEAEQRRAERDPGMDRRGCAATVGGVAERRASRGRASDLVRRRQHRAVQADRPARRPVGQARPGDARARDAVQRSPRRTRSARSAACTRRRARRRHADRRRAPAMRPSAAVSLSRHRNARPAGRRGRGAATARNSGVSRISSVRSRGSVAVDHVDDAPGPRRHHHDPGREEHRLGDRVGDEDARSFSVSPRAAAAAR